MTPATPSAPAPVASARETPATRRGDVPTECDLDAPPSKLAAGSMGSAALFGGG
jgi:hypothetical protein